MRVVHAVALTAASLLLASFASAQGIGDAAAQEKAKKKQAQAQGQAKPAKVYTDTDLGSGSVTSKEPALPTDAEAAAKAGEKKPADAQATDAKPGGDQKTEEQQKAEAEAAWRKRLDQARKDVDAYQDVVNKVQLDLNDMSGGAYSASRAAKIAFLDDNKQKLAAAQAQVASLEEEGRRSGYR